MLDLDLLSMMWMKSSSLIMGELYCTDRAALLMRMLASCLANTMDLTCFSCNMMRENFAKCTATRHQQHNFDSLQMG